MEENEVTRSLKEKLSKKVRGRRIMEVLVDADGRYPNQIVLRLSGNKLLVIKAPHAVVEAWVNNIPKTDPFANSF